MGRTAISHALGLVGAILGGLVGFYAFRWIVGQGFYALVLPGALLGLGCGRLARHDSTARGIACGLAAAALGLFCEWKEFPFRADASFGYFLGHATALRPLTLIMITLGAVVAFWTGRSSALGKPVIGRRGGRLKLDE